MTAAFTAEFTIPFDSDNVQIMFDYSLSLTASVDEGDFVQALGSVTGAGVVGGSIVLESVAGTGEIDRLNGDDRDVAMDTGSLKFTANIGPLPAGTYTLALGGLLSGKDSADEEAHVEYDNIMVLVDFTPTEEPTGTPTTVPTAEPTFMPIGSPTASPTQMPTLAPTNPPVKPPIKKVIDADFKKSTDGFYYKDDVFKTKQPKYAKGDYWKKNGGMLAIRLGNVDNRKIWDMSGKFLFLRLRMN